MLARASFGGPLLWWSIALSSHSSSQSHRLTSFGDVEITASRACGLVVFGSCGLLGGIVVLGKADSWGWDVTDQVGYRSFVSRLGLLVLLYVPLVRNQAF